MRACLLYIVSIAGLSVWHGQLPIAVWGLGFTHYYIYLLAVAYRAVPIRVLKRDAILMKAAALAPLAAAYLAEPLSPLSLAVVGGGFALNAAGAAALGANRTYYGHEIDGLPFQRITAFPYSITAHPMLLGNLLGFAGMLINPTFASAWWTVVAAHGAANAGLIVMETSLSRRERCNFERACHRPVVFCACLMTASAAAGGWLALGAEARAVPWLAAAAAAAFAVALRRTYGPRRAAA